MKADRGSKPSDASLVRRIQAGDAAAFAQLSRRFLPLLRHKAAQYAGSRGLDTDDLVQEGLLALYRATITYCPENGTGFETYASVCIRNGMVDAVRRQARGVHRREVSLDEIGDGLLRNSAYDAASAEPEEAYVQDEQYRGRVRQMGHLLSRLERQVLSLRIQGNSYQQISGRLHIPEKAVDNAMQRVRRKLKASE